MKDLHPLETYPVAGPVSKIAALRPLISRRVFLALLDNEGLLCMRKMRCLYLIPLLSQTGNRGGKLQLQTVRFSGIGSCVQPFRAG